MEKNEEIYHINEGARIGPYRLEKCLGHGGMAEVFVAFQLGAQGFAKPVCIKKILPHLCNNSEAVQLFAREARLAAKLNHPNIVSIFDLIEDGPLLAIVMEFIEGIDLNVFITKIREQGETLHQEIAIYITSQILKGLLEANNQGVVHRDISPHNILLSRNGGVKIADFGVAKSAYSNITKTGQLKGKLAYMSPEQARADKNMDGRTDLYSTGLVLYEMLTGRRYFNSNHDSEILSLVLSESPPRLEGISPELVPFLTKMLEPNRDKRFPNALEALNSLPLYPELGHKVFFELATLVKTMHKQLIDVRAVQNVWSSSSGSLPTVAKGELIPTVVLQDEGQAQSSSNSTENSKGNTALSKLSSVSVKRWAALVGLLLVFFLFVLGVLGSFRAVHDFLSREDKALEQQKLVAGQVTFVKQVPEKQNPSVSTAATGQEGARQEEKTIPLQAQQKQDEATIPSKVVQTEEHIRSLSEDEISQQLRSISSKVSRCLSSRLRAPRLITVQVEISKDGSTDLKAVHPKISRRAKRCIARHVSGIEFGEINQQSLTVTHSYRIAPSKRASQTKTNEQEEIRTKVPF